MEELNAMSVKTTYPKKRIIRDNRIYTTDHYYIGLDWWSRNGHFNEILFRKLVNAKRQNENRN